MTTDKIKTVLAITVGLWGLGFPYAVNADSSFVAIEELRTATATQLQEMSDHQLATVTGAQVDPVNPLLNFDLPTAEQLRNRVDELLAARLQGQQPASTSNGPAAAPVQPLLSAQEFLKRVDEMSRRMLGTPATILERFRQR